VTSNLPKRIYEHRNKLIDGFSKRYNLTRLVYYEACLDADSAITREKTIKHWKREWKINTINQSINQSIQSGLGRFVRSNLPLVSAALDPATSAG